MEETALKQPAMVSRLPKFSSRTPAPGTFSNGSALPVSCGGSKGKQNGVIRFPPSLSLKEKEDGGEKVLDTGEDVGVPPRSQQRQPQRSAVAAREIRKPSATVVGKASRPSPCGAGPGPRTPLQSTRANPRATVPKPPSPGQPLGASRAGINGISSSSGSVKPGAASALSPLSQSNDSLRSLPMEHVVRSRSFSYLKNPTSSTAPALTRSFSFNRAAELAKELPRPLAQSPLARSPATQPSLVLASEKVGAFGFPKSALAPSSGCPLPPTALKKSLLPSCSVGKPSALSYRLMRPSLIKQPRPLLAGKIQAKTELTQRDMSFQATAPPISEPSSNTQSAGTTPEEPSSGKETDVCRGPALEVPEDMSLSSTSSLERNDISEEYMDDFDDLGNGGGSLLLAARGSVQAALCEDDNALISQYQEGSSVTSLHSFLSETVDWAEMGITGSRVAAGPSPRCVSEVLSVSGDAPHGSSLDLSPSDSSGGTYMWDEEVLEPLEAVPHGCGSYDSDLNSMDILNNLDNLESGHLEEDDLMLDVDLPDDVSFHSGQVSYKKEPPPPEHPPRESQGAALVVRCVNEAGGDTGLSAFELHKVECGQNGSALTFLARDLTIPERQFGFAEDEIISIKPRSGSVSVCCVRVAVADVDGMCHYERSEGDYWPGSWRRQQQWWGRQDKLHDDNRGGVWCSVDDGHVYLGRRDSGQASLDELILKHMTQDCSCVKEQLLQLRRLLQYSVCETDGPFLSPAVVVVEVVLVGVGGGAISITSSAFHTSIQVSSITSSRMEQDDCGDDVGESTASPSSEDTSCHQQVEELLKEVQVLREELRGKERLITQLTQQMSTPMDMTQCHCPQGEPQTQEHQDKGTQTPWRVQTLRSLFSCVGGVLGEVYAFLCGWALGEVPAFLCGWALGEVYAFLCEWALGEVPAFLCGWGLGEVYAFLCGWGLGEVYAFLCGWGLGHAPLFFPLSPASTAGDSAAARTLPPPPESGGASALHQRYSVPQILQLAPESPSRHQELETLSSPVPTGAPSDRVDAQPGDGSVRPQPCTLVLPASSVSNAVVLSAVPANAVAPATAPTAAIAASSSTRDSGPDGLRLLLHTHLRIGDLHSAAVRGPRGRKPRPDDPHPSRSSICAQRTATPQGARVSARIGLGRESPGGAPPWPRRLPPPSRGLPCIISAPQAATLGARPPPAAAARVLGDASTTRDTEPGSGRASELPRPCFSRLRTPKSH
ncbi:hypothetical protein P4O66_011247 [Electrophorus voltai]|uniref:Uncharacterized protein n=1 Tax=Electrophorus voltai TaxID=2609070 RepID=A0AAD9DV56_9TELE|nr:hypothetical protein P4O66_011247 [Electrophorus voltai]